MATQSLTGPTAVTRRPTRMLRPRREAYRVNWWLTA